MKHKQAREHLLTQDEFDDLNLDDREMPEENKAKV